MPQKSRGTREIPFRTLTTAEPPKLPELEARGYEFLTDGPSTNIIVQADPIGRSTDYTERTVPRPCSA